MLTAPRPQDGDLHLEFTGAAPNGAEPRITGHPGSTGRGGLGDHEMNCTCIHCGYDQVSWEPRLWTEAQVGSLARMRANQRPATPLPGGRGFVLFEGRYALDRSLRCSRCRRTFYPGDALNQMVTASPKPTPSRPKRPALPH